MRTGRVRNGYTTQTANIAGAVATVKTATSAPTIIYHREIVSDVVATVPAQNVSFVVNARNSQSFPFLSRLAANYDMYHFKYLWYEYVPEVGTTTPGSLVMTFDYDVTDDNSAATFDMLSAYAGAVSGQVYAPMRLNFSPSNTVIAAHKYFCKAEGAPDRLCDVARLLYRLQIAPTVAAGTPYGKIFVNYAVELFSPELTAVNLGVSGSVENRSTSNVPVTASNGSVLGNVDILKLVEQLSGHNVTDTATYVSRFIMNNPQIIGKGLNVLSKGSLSVLGYPDLTAGWQLVTGDGPAPIDFQDIANYVIVADTTRLGNDICVSYRIAGTYEAADPVNAPSPLMNIALNNLIFETNACPKFPDTQVQEPLVIGNLTYMFAVFYCHVLDRDKPIGIALGVSPNYGTWTAVSPGSASWINVAPVAHTMHL